MLIKNGYHLGKAGNSFFVWDGKKHLDLKAKTMQEAIKEAEKLIEKQK